MTGIKTGFCAETRPCASAYTLQAGLSFFIMNILSSGPSWFRQKKEAFTFRLSGMILFVKLEYRFEGERITLSIEPTEGEWRITLPDGTIYEAAGEWEEENILLLRHGSRTMRVPVLSDGEQREILWKGQVYRFERETSRRPRAAHHSASEGILTAPMPGLIIKIPVQVGESVQAGQRLLVLEAMKMEQALTAPFKGTVKHLHTQEGEIVTEGTVLIEVEKDSSLA